MPHNCEFPGLACTHFSGKSLRSNSTDLELSSFCLPEETSHSAAASFPLSFISTANNKIKGKNEKMADNDRLSDCVRVFFIIIIIKNRMAISLM